MANFNFAGERAIDSPSLRVEVQPLFRMVYMWMGFGLLTTAVVAFIAGQTFLTWMLENPWVFIVAFVGQLGLVIGLSAGINRLSTNAAAIMFFLYAALMGITLSFIPLVYSGGSIVAALVTTTALFGTMTVVGFTTQIDLTKYSSYFMMGLIGLVIAMFVNMLLLRSGPFDLLISIFGVILFTALTAYDTQKIKHIASNPEIQADGNLVLKMAILGALALYLDFINLFLFLLRIFGGGRD